jgi:Holliday junction resolvasome RuvABC endonuclease subunit
MDISKAKNEIGKLIDARVVMQREIESESGIKAQYLSSFFGTENSTYQTEERVKQISDAVAKILSKKKKAIAAYESFAAKQSAAKKPAAAKPAAKKPAAAFETAAA